MVVLIVRAANHGGAAVGGQSDGDTLPTADAASLAAVTPVLLSQADQASINEATTLFNSQASLVKGIGTVTLTVTASDHALTRTVNVTYQTTSSTLFGGFTGKSSIAIAGMSQSSATVPPNIDFYLLLDNSPSMAIAATTDGVERRLPGDRLRIVHGYPDQAEDREQAECEHGRPIARFVAKKIGPGSIGHFPPVRGDE
jgi:hypothetical protein